MTYAVINSNDLVVNTILWDGASTWSPPENCIAVLVPEGSEACIGWSYVNGEFIPPNTDAPPP